LLLPNLILTDEEAIEFMDQLLQVLNVRGLLALSYSKSLQVVSIQESLEGLDILLILLDCERTREYAALHSDGMEMDSMTPLTTSLLKRLTRVHSAPVFDTISQLPPIAKALSANVDIIGDILNKEVIR